jgi:hypothetical protein
VRSALPLGRAIRADGAPAVIRSAASRARTEIKALRRGQQVDGMRRIKAAPAASERLRNGTRHLRVDAILLANDPLSLCSARSRPSPSYLAHRFNVPFFHPAIFTSLIHRAAVALALSSQHPAFCSR